MKERVGVIGLGTIGAGVVKALARNGFGPVGYDIRPEAAQGVTELTSTAASPRELSEHVEVVFVAVFDDAQVRSVMSGDDSLLAADSPATDIVILSTVSPDTIRWAAEQGSAQGISVLDCGVTGGQGLRQQGQIVAMVGGDAGAVARVRVLLETFGAPVVHTGALGTGMRAKLARNMITYGRYYVVLEAVRLAAAGGIDIAKFIEINDAADNLMGGSLSLVRSGVRPGVPADAADEAVRRRLAGYLHKDLHAAAELARELGVEIPAAVLVGRAFDDMVGIGADHTA